MKRDTKRIEKLLAGVKACRQLVREEIGSGASLQHMHDEMLSHEQQLASRLRDLTDWNKKQGASNPLEAGDIKKPADMTYEELIAAGITINGDPLQENEDPLHPGQQRQQRPDGQPLNPAGSETNAPETNAPETNAPETNAPETNAPETNAPETNAPETNAPETNAPETNAPETNARKKKK